MNKNVTSKETLLKTAEEIAHEEGLARVSIRRVAAENGIAIGTVYNYFPSKSDLVAEIMEDFWRDVFHGGGFDTESRDFAASLEALYQRLRESFGQFQTRFLEDMASMSQKPLGRSLGLQGPYLDHMKQGMLRILERDPKVRREIWTDTFTEQVFVDFVFANVFWLLRDEKEDCRYLELIVRRLIYQE